MNLWARLENLIAADGAATLVTLVRVRGSSPREAGARMIVARSGATGGTIGGGALEWQAQALAEDLMAREGGVGTLRPFALGPGLGQCCGGHVEILVEAFARSDAAWIAALAKAEAGGPFSTEAEADKRGIFPRRISLDQTRAGLGSTRHDTGLNFTSGCLNERHGEDRTPLLLFGAGHVGRALVLALAPLPFAVRWVETRPDAFPSHQPTNATPVQTADPSAEITAMPAGSLVAIMTHSHALDLDIAAAALARQDMPYVGVIGSETKRARFLSHLGALGQEANSLKRLACPIGGHGFRSKAPPIIAASMAVALLEARELALEAALSPRLIRRA
jgi:xanthine dehydrogenase accessory factor